MKSSNDPYKLEKTVWSDADFEQMGWHDCYIHGISFGNGSEENGTSDLLMDIDYIFGWVNPIEPDRFFKFWIAPCTLVFENTMTLEMSIDEQEGLAFVPFQISDITILDRLRRGSDPYGYHWKVWLQSGYLKIKSYGFKQYVRRNPVQVPRQYLSLEERKGISFLKEYSES